MLANPAEQEAANDVKGEAKPNETGGTDLALEFPAFCGWAPVVCEAAQVAISFPNTVAEWWNYSKTKSEEWVTAISQSWAETKDWAKAEPETPAPETPPEIPDAALIYPSQIIFRVVLTVRQIVMYRLQWVVIVLT